jgi:hypothetical protein
VILDSTNCVFACMWSVSENVLVALVSLSGPFSYSGVPQKLERFYSAMWHANPKSPHPSGAKMWRASALENCCAIFLLKRAPSSTVRLQRVNAILKVY